MPANIAMDSFSLLDCCRLSPVLLSGSMMLRSGGSSSAWQQAHVLLSDRAMLWLSPPGLAWAGVSLENATIALAPATADGGGGVGAGEAFEVSTARQTLHFRCRGAAIASRWVALAQGVAEQRTGNGLLESAEVVRADRLEASLHAPASELMTMASTQARLAAFSRPAASGEAPLPSAAVAAAAAAAGSAASPSDEALAVGYARILGMYVRGSRSQIDLVGRDLPQTRHVNVALAEALGEPAGVGAGSDWLGLAAAVAAAHPTLVEAAILAGARAEDLVRAVGRLRWQAAARDALAANVRAQMRRWHAEAAGARAAAAATAAASAAPGGARRRAAAAASAAATAAAAVAAAMCRRQPLRAVRAPLLISAATAAVGARAAAAAAASDSAQTAAAAAEAETPSDSGYRRRSSDGGESGSRSREGSGGGGEEPLVLDMAGFISPVTALP